MLIDTKILFKLPPESTYIKNEVISDMDNESVTAMVFVWTDKNGSRRKGYFSPETGDYLGEAS